MSWFDTSKLPSLDSIKSKMNDSMTAMNTSVKDMATSMQEAAKKNAPKASEMMGSMRDVFNLDNLNTNSDSDAGKISGSHFFPIINLVYATSRVGCVGFPENATVDGLADFLNGRHQSNYIIWNISEKEVPTENFQGNIVEFKFPGLPAPPMALLFKICISIESWLNQSPSNVAFVMCQTGRGRSITLASCLLEWIGKARDSKDGLHYLCTLCRCKFSQTILPSQRRYARAFHEVINGKRPNPNAIIIRRVVMTKFPDLLSDADKARPGMPSAGCTPYFQIYKDGKLVFTTVWADKESTEGTKTYSCASNETVIFDNINCLVHGDILIRVRHLERSTGQGESMCRLAFHTGFVPLGVWSLTKAELDGANAEKQYSKDFTLELEFASAEGTQESFSSQDSEYDLTSETEFWDTIAQKRLHLEDVRQAADAARKQKQAAEAQNAEGGKPASAAAPETKAFSIVGDDDDDDAFHIHEKMLKEETKRDSLSEELGEILASHELASVPQNKEVSSSATPPKPVVETTAAKTSTLMNDDNLDELDVLAWELDNTSSSTTTTTMTKAAASTTPTTTKTAAPVDDDADLLELESFLNDL